MNIQKIGGNFIIKCFDLTNLLNLKIFYILCHLYEKTIITKLKTSRKTNSERYIIFKNYKKILDKNIMKNIFDVILKWDSYIIENKIIDIFNFNLNKVFLDKLEVYNSWFFRKQLDIYSYIININNNLSNILIKNIIKEKIINNIEDSILFCKLNKIFINYSSYFIITDIDQIINNHFSILIV